MSIFFIKKTEEEKQQARKEYYLKNKEKRKEKRKEYDKKYYQTHKTEKREYENNKRKTDIHFKLADNLRSRLGIAIRNNQKSGSAVQDLGCSIPELKVYLESKFQEGMSWDNWSRTGWHIDHIIPLSSFDLDNREEFLKACHYTNLQPMWAEENIKKRDIIIEKIQK